MTMLPKPALPANPVVTLIVAMRNEAPNIKACLDSILTQAYPVDSLEILVYDGESTDDSMAIAERVLAGTRCAAIRSNPRRTQAAAWNLGIDAAAGDVIGIVSGHAILMPGYVAAAVECLRRTGAAMVGGPVRAIAEGAVGQAIALATSTSFGVGGARFRYLEHEEQVDTVFMGLSPAAVYRHFRFDEEMVRNQDDELSYRILDAGGVIVCSPAIQSAYHSRATLRSLWLQYFDYGSWKVRVAQKHPAQVRIRHLAPAALVASIAGTAALGLAWRPALFATAGITLSYVTAIGLAVVHARARAGWRVLAFLPAVYVTLHGAYGSGFLTGLIRHRAWTMRDIRIIADQVVRRARS